MLVLPACLLACNSVFGVDALSFGSNSGASDGAGGIGGAGGPPSVGGVGGVAGATSAGGDAPVPICGNGVIESDEQCDDSNLIADDGCDADCNVECQGGNLATLNGETFHCYVVFLQTKTWGEARATCFALGPGFDLYAPSSQVEMDAIIMASPPGEAWTCGNDLVTEGVYEWGNGETWGFAPWSLNEPNDSGDCISASTNGTIKDGPCSDVSYVLCERPPAGR
jgi:cysteine-rich repeat protein